MPAGRASDDGPQRSVASLVGLAALACVLIAILAGLGTWQIHRRAWKLDLIARVNARIHAASAPPPAPADWPSVTAAADDYRHVVVTGHFVDGAETLVQAVTDYGPGFWVLTPLQTSGDYTVLINRGFVPSEMRDPAKRPADDGKGEVSVTGLLRTTEPGGAFLRHNDPDGDRWFSRDIAAIAARRGLGTVAPYFIDAEGPAQAGRYPIGGLTLVSFPNSHLVYAITWYALALMLTGAVIGVGRGEWRRRQSLGASSTVR